MLSRRVAISGLAAAFALLLGVPPAAWSAPLQEARIAVKGMVCPA